MTSNPFGTTVTSDDIIDTLGFFDGWEERYKYIIDLGRELPPMADAKKDDAHLVRGCQSQVWIDARRDSGRLWFETDSDAFIVKGLLAVVLAAYNGKRPDEVLAFDIEDYFRRLDLLRHLSPTRGNGLRAMVKRIRTMAVEAAA
jgi:cysteine desulfuration protein SufE